MPSSYATRRYTHTRLVPFYPGAYNRRRNVNLAPLTTFPAGQWLGIAGVTANATHTLTTTGTPTGGSQTLQFVDPMSGDTNTFVVAFDSTNAQAQTAIRAAIGNSDVAVTGGAQPGTALVFTYTGRYAGKPVAPLTVATNGLTGGTAPAGAITSTLGRTANTYGLYVGGSATDPAKALLEYPCVTDANGWVVKGGQAYAGEGNASPAVPAWFGGVFRLGDTVGYDAGAIVDIGARFESGSISDVDSIIIIP
jgi:hypothetical protein